MSVRKESLVNASATPQIAANGNSLTGRLQESLHQSQPQSWWHKYFQWERNLTVAGRTIEKGWVVSQGMGIALMVILIGGVGGLYWRIIDKQREQDNYWSQRFDKQNEMLIRIDQRLLDKQAQDEKNDRDHKNKDDLQDLQIKNLELAQNPSKRGKS